MDNPSPPMRDPEPLTKEEREENLTFARDVTLTRRGVIYDDDAHDEAEQILRYEATLRALESASLSVPPGEDAKRLYRLNELLGPSPMDALQSAFIAGMDKCREVQTAYGEWPSPEGRCEMARDAFPDDDSLIDSHLPAMPLRDLALRADTLARNVAQYPERIPDLIAATNALYEAAAHSSSSVPCEMPDDTKIARLEAERLLLAKLAAETPQFDNPLVAFEAQALRDRLLNATRPYGGQRDVPEDDYRGNSR